MSSDQVRESWCFVEQVHCLSSKTVHTTKWSGKVLVIFWDKWELETNWNNTFHFFILFFASKIWPQEIKFNWTTFEEFKWSERIVIVEAQKPIWIFLDYSWNSTMTTECGVVNHSSKGKMVKHLVDLLPKENTLAGIKQFLWEVLVFTFEKEKLSKSTIKETPINPSTFLSRPGSICSPWEKTAAHWERNEPSW